jgi:hypothetical protein
MELKLPVGRVPDLVEYLAAIEEVQGGSDKSGILKVFFKNYTAQLKIIRFHQNKNTLAEEHIEN